MPTKQILLSILTFITFNILGQNPQSRSTDIKIQRLLFLIEQMYVEEVDEKKLQSDLVLGMYNYIKQMALYQTDSEFEMLGIIPSEKTSLGF